jgi:hypothetical protein
LPRNLSQSLFGGCPAAARRSTDFWF